MKNPEKVMKVVSVIILVGSILYVIGGGIFAAVGIFMAVFAGTEGFAAELAEGLERKGVSVEMLGDAAAEWNEKLGTTFSIMELMRLFFIVLAVMGVAMIVYAVIGIVCSGMGLKGALGEKAGKAFVLGIVLLVCTLVRFVVNFDLDAVEIVKGLISFVLPALYTYAARCLKN